MTICTGSALPRTHAAMAGKLADMVIMNANPLDDIRNSDQLSHVVLNGRVYKADTLEEVTTGNKKLQPFWWQTTPQGSIR